MRTILVAGVCLLLAGVPGWAQMRVDRLSCEYRVSPEGVDVPRPLLQWWSESARPGAKVTAYQVLVASTAARLDRGEGDLWDSGRVEGDPSGGVFYAGRALGTGELCWWKVRVWDESGKASPWSAPSTWTMGVMRAEDWSARWIAGGTEPPGPAPLMRGVFVVTQEVVRATLHVSGLGFHEVHLNGQRVGDRELDPGFTRYDRRVQYVTHDRVPGVRVGTNVLAVELGNGWYDHAVLAKWNFENAPWRDRPKLLCQLDLTLRDGSRQRVVSDAGWKWAPGPLLDNQLLTGETYDARREVPGWTLPGFDDAAWTPVREAVPPAGTLSAAMQVPVRVKETLRPVSVTEPRPGVWLFDFGRSVAGVPRLTVSGPAGTEVVMRFGEVLRPDGTLDQKRIAEHTLQPGFQTDKYILSGRGTETWRVRFTYHGFRYAEVTGLPSAPGPGTLEALAMHADFEEAGAFECSNDLINRILLATRRSYLNNFFSLPTDCPHREKNGWTGDAHLAVETGLYNYRGMASYVKWLQDIQDEQPPSGELPGTVPTAGFGYKWGNGPAWDAAYLLIPWACYEFTGDRRMLEQHYPGFKRYVDYVTRRSPNGIAAFGLGDWCPAKTRTPAEVTSTAYAAVCARVVARVAALLGREDEARDYAARAETFRAAFERAYFKPDTALVANGSQTALACALYQGMTRTGQTERVVSNLVQAVEAKGGHLDCGILGTKYLLHALTDAGRSDVAWRVVTQTNRPSWGYWMAQGATTLWEDWSDKPGSRDHIMFGDISAWCFRVLAGIRPDPAGPGFRRAVIRPDPVPGLDWVRAHHDAPHGRLNVAWTRTGAEFELRVVLPPGTVAEIHVPCDEPGDVTANGKPVRKARGLRPLRTEPGRCVVEAGSGAHVFRSHLAR